MQRVSLLVAMLFCFNIANRVAGAEPKIESFDPCIVTAGETQTIKISGEGLDKIQSLVFYADELECLEVTADGQFEASAVVRVGESTLAGAVPFRVLTSDGFSNAKVLRVTTFPVVSEPERLSENAAVALDAGHDIALYGTLLQGEYDRYTLDLQTGQRCTAVVEAVKLGGPLIDTVLKVYAPNGDLIHFVDDTSLYQQDPCLSFIAGVAGRYTIEIHETNYDGSTDSRYVLYLGDFPNPTLVYPAGGKAGEPFTITSLSANDPEEFEISGLSDAGGWQSLRLERDGKTTPTAIPIRIVDFGNVLEAQENDSPKDVVGSVSQVPVAFNGILEKQNDSDHFAFQAEAGKIVRFECFAERLGSPADSYLSIVDIDGNVLLSNDDWSCHDSQLDFVAKESGIYFVQVRDKLGNGGPTSLYRVEAAPPSPVVTAFLPRPVRRSSSGQVVSVAQGNRAVVNMAVRRELVKGAAAVLATEVPDGVDFPTAEIPADRYWMPVVVSASETAPVGGRLIPLRARCGDGKEAASGGFDQAIDLVADSADRLFHGVRVDRLPVAVVERLPFKVDLVPPTAILAAGGSLNLKILVSREEGFEEPIIVKFPYLPPWVTCEPEVKIPAGEVEAEHTLNARFEADAREWPIVVVGEVDVRAAKSDVGSLRGKQAASEIVTLTVGESPIKGEFEPLAAEQGQTFHIQCRFERRGELPEKLTAVLSGLPPRCDSKPIELDAQQNQAEFEIKVGSDTPVGRFDSVFCHLKGELNGQSVSYVVADGTMIQIAEPGKLTRGKLGELLSPLEALRQSSESKNN